MAGEAAPMGGNLTETGATFRIWAPAATTVILRGSFNGWTDQPMTRDGQGYWFASVPGVREGHTYKFYVDGMGSDGYKRDPYARSLTLQPAWPINDCNVTRPGTFPWHDAGFRPPAFHDLVIYQLHVGAFYSADPSGRDVRAERPGRFLDTLYKLEYLVDLGITAIQLLPIQEFSSKRSLGYNGIDYFSPEMSYSVPPDDPDLARYVARANELLARRGLSPYGARDLDCQTKQLMALVDLCHVYGLAVIFDVVYNHAGGEFGDEGIYFLDRQSPGDHNRSLYFTDQGWAGGLVFAYWKRAVRQFLIDNAGFFFDEYHVDGFRFDEVTVIDRYGGWEFLQDLTSTLRYRKPSAPLIAEYWADQGVIVRPVADGGAGFDSVVSSGLRQAVRRALEEASRPGSGALDLDWVARELRPDHGAAWRTVEHLENHDIVRVDNTTDRGPRIPALADALQFAFVVRAEPLAGRHRTLAHGARHPDAVHGPGVPGGQVLERQPRLLSHEPHLVGRARVGPGDAGSPAVRAGAPAGAPGDARAARRPDQRLPRRQRQPRASLPPLDRRRRSRRRGGGESARPDVVGV